MAAKKYFKNSFFLLVPILLWNAFFMDDLPAGFQAETFWNEIPPYISYPENILRIVLFSMPIFLTFSIKKSQQRVGFLLYITGCIIYFSSWLVLIIYPDQQWSNSHFGFTAPSYTPIIWLMGIALMSDQSLVKIPKPSLL